MHHRTEFKIGKVMYQSSVLRDRTNVNMEPRIVLVKKIVNNNAAMEVSSTAVNTRSTRLNKRNMRNKKISFSNDDPKSSSKETTSSDSKPTKKKKLPEKRVVTRSKTPINDDKTDNDEPSSLSAKKLKKFVHEIPTRSKRLMNNDGIEPSTSQVGEKTKKSVQILVTRSKARVNVSNTGDKSSPSPRQEVQKRSLRSRKSISTTSTKTPTKRRPSLTIGKPGTDRKFFKNATSKQGLNVQSKISPLKRAVLGLKEKPVKNKNSRVIPVARDSSSFHLRQPTLEESISKIPKKSLRPRIANKNYCDESTLINEHSSLKVGTNNEHERYVDGKRRPIYKRTNLNASQEKDKEKVYDFVPDKNDVVQKKKKKRIVRKAAEKRKAKTADADPKKVTKTTKKTNLVIAKVADNIKAVNKSNKKTTVDKKTAAAQKPVVLKMSKNNDNAVDDMEIMEHSYDPSTEIMENQSLGVQLEETLKLPPTHGVRIISDEELQGENIINITKTPLQPTASKGEFSRPFRATNAFNSKPSMQVKTMMDTSLFRQSLSPISKAAATAFIEDGSPWRSFPIPAWSTIRNVVQSTPMGEKFNQMPSKTAVMPKRQPRTVRLNNIVEKNDENANVPKKSETSSVENIKSPVKKIVSPNKNETSNSKSPRQYGPKISNLNSPVDKPIQISPSKSPRKFGVEISNMNQTNAKVLNPKNLNNPISAVQNSKKVKTPPAVVEVNSKVRSPMQEVEDVHKTLDKENSAPNDHGAKTTSRKRLETVDPTKSPCGNVEAFELQPVNTWHLKQSNLNNFLNLPEMPESTRITAQGIFDDAHSTPITTRRAPKALPVELNVANAFGFDELEEDTPQIDISSIRSASICQEEPAKKIIQKHKKNVHKQRQENEEAHPARFSIGEIKKTLKTKEVKSKKDINNEKNTQTEAPMSPKGAVVQAISFRDTFDVKNTEEKENIEQSIKEVPLFYDLEPAHFTEPPRYSYKRKRHDKYDTSVETEDEHDENNDEGKQKRPQKKRKVGKAAKEQQKQLNEWAKNINKTFDEIDDFDLLVE